jgi:hypothetical protein
LYKDSLKPLVFWRSKVDGDAQGPKGWSVILESRFNGFKDLFSLWLSKPIGEMFALPDRGAAREQAFLHCRNGPLLIQGASIDFLGGTLKIARRRPKMFHSSRPFFSFMSHQS